MRSISLIIALSASIAISGSVFAQAPGGGRTAPDQGVTCPPDVKGDPPTVGSGKSGDLSDKLAQSKGIICPPSGIDGEMQVAPPGGGQLKVIPPPGAPGGDQRVQPK